MGLLALAGTGCKSTKQRIADAVRTSALDDPSAGSALCGYSVLRLSEATVSNVTNVGSSSAGTGTATVTGTPVGIPGQPVTPTCVGTVAFSYGSSGTASYTVAGRRRTTGTGLRVYNISVTSRQTVPPAGVATNPGGTYNPTPGFPTPGYPTPTPGYVPPTPGYIPPTPSYGGSGRTALTQGMITPTSVGMIAQGVLVAGDTALSNGSVADDYAITLTAGMPVTIVVRGGPSITSPGSTLDVYTILMQNGVELTHDDDGAGYPNSRIMFTPPSTGTYIIRVTTFGGGMRSGSYTVQTWPGMNPSAT